MLLFLFFFLSADVLSEEAILKWYTEAHVAKGKSVFLEQMKKFVEWLKNAEEGNLKKKKKALTGKFSHRYFRLVTAGKAEVELI